MNVLLYHSSDGKAGREKLRRQHMPTGVPKESFPVIITSFEVVMNDRRFLAKYKWKYIVVDEVRRRVRFLLEVYLTLGTSLTYLLIRYKSSHFNITCPL